MHPRGFRLACTGLLLSVQVFVAQGQPATSGTPRHVATGVTELYDFIVRHQADRGSLGRYYFVAGSPERNRRMQEFYRDQQAQLDAMNFASLSVGGKADWLLMKRECDYELHGLREEAALYDKVAPLVSTANPLYDMEKQRRRGKQPNSEQLAAQLATIGRELEADLKRMGAVKPMHPREAAFAAEVLSGQRAALRSVTDFYNGYDPQFSWWVSKPAQRADTLLAQLARRISAKADSSLLPKDDGSGIIGQPIGRQELIRLLRYEYIPYTPEELIDIANREFAWCERELIKASREMGFGDNWKAAQEKVKMSFVPPGQQPEAMLKLYEESVAFLKKHDLISIPPLAEETWRMRMIPPRQQLISPFFLGGEVLQISYPTDEMEHADKLMSMRGNNPHFSRATVHHELIAGHHLQQFMNNRHHAYRSYRTPFWTEGWALYWEFILWDMGFPRGPEDRIGMLFWRMHRCARIIFSLNYHLGKWTPQQCIDLLVDKVGHERANAEGEVRRSFTSNYGPLYQLAYMTGAFQFYALKKELVDGGRMSLKQFHDAVMRENSMPVEMLRFILSDKHPPRDYQTNWRFYSGSSSTQ